MRKHGADASPPVHAVRGCSTDDDPDRSTTMIWLRFESHLAAEPPSVWLHATQMRGVNAELSPLVRMSVPQAYACLTLRDAQQGSLLFKSRSEEGRVGKDGVSPF